jgi:hypothetical protein
MHVPSAPIRCGGRRPPIYEQTRNIEVIRELLGQKSVSATSAYLNVGKKKALAIARKFDI